MFMRKRLTGKELRKKRLRHKIRGSKARPRLSVFRSHKYIYGQIINDEKGVTLAAASEKEIGQVKSDKPALPSGRPALPARLPDGQAGRL